MTLQERFAVEEFDTRFKKCPKKTTAVGLLNSSMSSIAIPKKLSEYTPNEKARYIAELTTREQIAAVKRQAQSRNAGGVPIPEDWDYMSESYDFASLLKASECCK